MFQYPLRKVPSPKLIYRLKSRSPKEILVDNPGELLISPSIIQASPRSKAEKRIPSAIEKYSRKLMNTSFQLNEQNTSLGASP